jgi:hypothetical protein
MPYNRKQCRLFYAKAKKGQKVPADFRRHCGEGKKKK